MATNTSSSEAEALQVAHEQVEVAAERDDIAAVPDHGTVRLYGCAPETS